MALEFPIEILSTRVGSRLYFLGGTIAEALADGGIALILDIGGRRQADLGVGIIALLTCLSLC
jgi:hypothetical protein